ncbi:MAG: PUA domain-containing protein [Candidatus Kariarchaeaceae archaeon]
MEFSKPSSFEIRQLKSVLAYQYGSDNQGDLSELFFEETEALVVYSRSTGRIRHVYDKNTRLFTIRASDGLITLSIEGAQKILDILPSPKSRVIVLNEVSSFISAGRSVFSKHIVNCDPNIRSQDEVIAVNEDDVILGVGTTLLPAQSLLDFNTGMGVKIRHGSGLI